MSAVLVGALALAAVLVALLAPELARVIATDDVLLGPFRWDQALAPPVA